MPAPGRPRPVSGAGAERARSGPVVASRGGSVLQRGAAKAPGGPQKIRSELGRDRGGVECPVQILDLKPQDRMSAPIHEPRTNEGRQESGH